MLRKVLALAFVVAFPPWASAQTEIQRATLMSAFDLDGEAADDNQIVEAAGGVIVDNGTSVGGVNYTITAQPDACRLIDMTISDTNMGVGAGTITVTGVGCLGEAKVCTWSAWTAGDDDGVKTLTCSDGEGAYMASVTSITTGDMTGESDEYFLLGYTSNSVNGWAMYGVRYRGPNGEWGVNPLGSLDIPKKVTTSGASSTTLTGVVGAEDAFELVSVGDLLILPVGGTPYERKVTAKASNDSITLNAAVNIAAAGQTFKLRKAYYSTNPAQEMFIPVHGYDTLLLDWSVDANVNTGGVVTLFQCIDSRQPDFPTGPWVELDTTTVASAGTQVPTSESVDLTLLPYTFCRFGVRFGTGDDGDGAAEDINASITLMKETR